ncbi:hypothetical protein LLEC1_04404 [Akanthomyces lecanii]|uniref:Calpain catalytic domain-containing protein n=1 Tax=Cordyceps confragosa TaxID=2714763 RepID=A0A179IDW2_CORDF|nr:hypothetical protein LLEC1_04404 [Akanthomyces lecanii]
MDGRTPQRAVDNFWKSFHTKAPGKATAVIPNKKRTKSKKATKAATPPSTQRADASYEVAAATCRAKVAKIVQDCRRVNRKYRDPHFNIEFDLKLDQRECLESLSNAVPDPETGEQPAAPGAEFLPRSAKRVTEIFTKPQFYINGPTANDVRQGNDGDCWLMAALCALSFKEGLIEKLCVAHDQDVGVYGFVFYRDGEWISEIVDDFLYLTKADYDAQQNDRIMFDELDYRNPQEAYTRIFQSNSNSLYFAQCEHPQETWLPLLEKCYAKAHGDYAAIEGGLGGEGVEDLTGGVASEFFATDILDKEHFWKQLLQANKEFLFGCSTGIFGGGFGSRRGIIEGHAYSIQRVVEIENQRLILLRNPWGQGEWKGAWADGSKEWSPEWMKKLGHKFGEDGEFWICYEDLLRHYQCFERVRLFGPEWNVSQIWTTLHAPWVQEYNETYFSFTTTQSGPVVIVVSQLDDRYFRGLEGQYMFQLSFRVHKAGVAGYIVRSETAHRMRRSANVELDLEAGAYEVYVKIKAWRNDHVLPVQATIRKWAKSKRDKVSRIGKAYDLAHSRGQIIESNEEKKMREAYEKRRMQKKRAVAKRDLQKQFKSAYYQKRKEHERNQIRAAKKKEKMKIKAVEKSKVKEERKAAKAAAKKAAAKERVNDVAAKDEFSKKTGVESVDMRNEVESAKAGEKSESKDVVREERKEDSKEDSKEAAKEEAREDTEKDETKDESEDSEEPESESDNESLASLTDYSDGELELQVDALERADPTMFDSPPEEEDSDEENGLFAKDPWNAVAVVGLRVYHKTTASGETVALSVRRPNPYADTSESDGEGTGSAGGGADGKGKGGVLDVDDTAMDATLQGELKEKKEMIMGLRKTSA